MEKLGSSKNCFLGFLGSVFLDLLDSLGFGRFVDDPVIKLKVVKMSNGKLSDVRFINPRVR